MIGKLVHTAFFGFVLLAASFASADEVDGMHPGLNGFRPGVGNELDTRHEPYVRMQEQRAEESRLSSRWGHYDEERDAGFGSSNPDCRTAMTENEDSPVSFGYMACGDDASSYNATPGRWDFSGN